MHENIDRILFTEDEIKQRVAEIGAGITQDYKDDPDGVILISVLRGAAIFMADLARQIQLPCEMDYMAVSSYGNGVKSSGVVRILKDLSSQIEGRNVVIAEDVLDSGLTLTYLLKTLKARNPKSIEVATLLRKKTRAQAKIDCAYVGFECPDEFIVGYGLDYAERYRNLPYIGVLKPELYNSESKAYAAKQQTPDPTAQPPDNHHLGCPFPAGGLLRGPAVHEHVGVFAGHHR